MQVPRRGKALWTGELSLCNRDGILDSVSSLIGRQEKGWHLAPSGRILPCVCGQKAVGTADEWLNGRLATSGMARRSGHVLEQCDGINVSTRWSCRTRPLSSFRGRMTQGLAGHWEEIQLGEQSSDYDMQKAATCI